ncbi:GAF domain-containing protein [candidate division KSB1 bacterium]
MKQSGVKIKRLSPTEEIEILREITRILSRNLELGKLLAQIVEVVVKFTHGDACLLYLLDGKKEELQLAASKNPHPRIMPTIRLRLGEGITGWVASHGETVTIAENAGEDPRFKLFHNLPEDHYQSFLSTPITSGEDLVGVINVQYRKPYEHKPNEIALLTTIAQQVGGAIEKARLYDEMKLRIDQNETLMAVSRTVVSDRYLEEILNLIALMTRKLMRSKSCSVLLLDEEKNCLVVKATEGMSPNYPDRLPLPIDSGISGRVLRERRPLTVHDVKEEADYFDHDLASAEGLAGLLCVPMLIKDRPVGVINIYTEQPCPFDAEEINIAQAIANQAAFAIENTKLIEEALIMRETLEARKTIDRAKGLLMSQRGISETQAHRLINKKSMDTGRPMREIAEAIILAADMDV